MSAQLCQEHGSRLQGLGEDVAKLRCEVAVLRGEVGSGFARIEDALTAKSERRKKWIAWVGGIVAAVIGGAALTRIK